MHIMVNQMPIHVIYKKSCENEHATAIAKQKIDSLSMILIQTITMTW